MQLIFIKGERQIILYIFLIKDKLDSASSIHPQPVFDLQLKLFDFAQTLQDLHNVKILYQPLPGCLKESLLSVKLAKTTANVGNAWTDLIQPLS